MIAFLALSYTLKFWLMFGSCLIVWAAVGAGLNIYCSRDWRWYAARFPVAVRPAGNAYRAHGWFKTVEIHGITVILTEAGIYFRGYGILPFYPPFLVPWRTVWEVNKKHGITNQFTHFQITIEYDMEKIVLSLPLAAEQDLLRYYKAPSLGSP